MLRSIRPRFLGLSAMLAVVSGCLPDTGAPSVRLGDGDGPDIVGIEDAGTDPRDLPPVADHAVLGVEPPHGPFSGGGLALVRGNGFTSDVRVWFGDHEVAAAEVVPVDPTRVQVVIPKGEAGFVDVTTQNGEDDSTKASQVDGYEYDSFYAEPASGPTSGGTELTLHGDSTHWDAATQVSIDLNPCEVTDVSSETELHCVTPPGTAGSKAIRVQTDDASTTDVLDAFTYGDSDNGYRGGLSGQPLDGELRVIALNSFTGLAIPHAAAIAGESIDTAAIGETNASGVAVISVDDSKKSVSVTVAAPCHQPITFVNVPVDTVTAYLDPVLSPECIKLKPELMFGGGGGTGFGSLGASVSGELVWGESREFQRGSWNNVPHEKGDSERRVAYVLPLSPNASDTFQRPGSTATVTPDSSGEVGYAYYLTANAGSLSLYAVAGIENQAQNPPTFTAYSMGLVRGVPAPANGTTNDIYIPMTIPLDHALELNVVPPATTLRGPDRLLATASVRVDSDNFAILPDGALQAMLPLDADPLRFVGVPPLVAALAGTSYVVTARAVSGADRSWPLSVLGLYSSTTTSSPLSLDAFVEVPMLESPGLNATWDRETLDLSWKAGGATVDLSVTEIRSGSELVTWTVVAPGNQKQIQLPRLDLLSPMLALVAGSVSVKVSAAHIRDFDYGSLRYRHLTSRGWDAYATDVYVAQY